MTKMTRFLADLTGAANGFVAGTIAFVWATAFFLLLTIVTIFGSDETIAMGTVIGLLLGGFVALSLSGIVALLVDIRNCLREMSRTDN